MNKRHLILFLIHTMLVSGQTKMSVSYLFDSIDRQNKNYNYNTEYFLYNNDNSKTILDHYFGTEIKKDKIIYQKKNKAECVNFGDYFVSINVLEKKVLISKSPKYNTQSLKSILKNFNRNKIIEDKDYWICELSTANSTKNKQSPMMVLYFDKKDLSLQKQHYYSFGKQEFLIKEKRVLIKNPLLEILFKKNSDISNQANSLLNKQNYFTLRSKKIVLSKRFRGYQLITI